MRYLNQVEDRLIFFIRKNLNEETIVVKSYFKKWIYQTRSDVINAIWSAYHINRQLNMIQEKNSYMRIHSTSKLWDEISFDLKEKKWRKKKTQINELKKISQEKIDLEEF